MIQFPAPLNLYLPLTGGTVTGPVVVSSASFGLSGDISAPTWTTSGVRYKNVTSTLTDTTAITGTTATAYTDVWGGNTIAAVNASVVFTSYFSSYFKNPVAGTNVTLTNAWALGADSLSVGTSGVFRVSTAGILTTTSAVLTTPALGVATGTSLALGGAAIGTNALAVTGSTSLAAPVGINGTVSGNIALRITGITSTGTHGLYITDSSGNVNLDVLDTGTVFVGRASLATNSTAGFPYLASGAGAPTGTPTVVSGMTPVYVDTTNAQVWLYLGGAWKQPKTPAAAATVTWQ